MNKNVIYLAILAVLAGIAYWAFNKEEALFPKNETNFRVKNIEDIDEIFLSDTKGNAISLNKKSENKWLINDSFAVRSDLLKMLLEALNEQEAVQVVPATMHDNIITLLAGNGVKVEVYKKDKKTHAFYVASEPGPNNTTIMLNIQEDGKNAPRPYIVKQGVRENFLGLRYQTKLEEWRDKQMLYVPLEDLSEIKVEFMRDTALNLLLQKTPSIKVIGSKPHDPDSLNMNRVEKYIQFYQRMYFMGFENDYILKDTFIKTFTPIANVTVKAKNMADQTLSIYYRQVHKGSNYILTVDGKQYDGDTFFGWLNKRDFVLLSKATIEKLLRGADEFYVQDPPRQKSNR
jgi:hypothetical protein